MQSRWVAMLELSYFRANHTTTHNTKWQWHAVHEGTHVLHLPQSRCKQAKLILSCLSNIHPARDLSRYTKHWVSIHWSSAESKDFFPAPPLKSHQITGNPWSTRTCFWKEYVAFSWKEGLGWLGCSLVARNDAKSSFPRSAAKCMAVVPSGRLLDRVQAAGSLNFPYVSGHADGWQTSQVFYQQACRYLFMIGHVHRNVAVLIRRS